MEQFLEPVKRAHIAGSPFAQRHAIKPAVSRRDFVTESVEHRPDDFGTAVEVSDDLVRGERQGARLGEEPQRGALPSCLTAGEADADRPRRRFRGSATVTHRILLLKRKGGRRPAPPFYLDP